MSKYDLKVGIKVSDGRRLCAIRMLASLLDDVRMLPEVFSEI